MKLNLSPRCSGGWGCAREQQLYPCWTATLWGWMASCPSTFPAEPSLGNTWSLCRLGHTLSAELTAPYYRNAHTHPFTGDPALPAGSGDP